MSNTSLAAAVGPYAQGQLSDEEVLPLVRDIFDNGLSREGIAELTHAMVASGVRMNFDDLGKPLVDKHSTGGVGDKITLILTPLIASYGVLVPQLAGRGLGFTGGTIDKLESIPGWNSHLGAQQMHTQLSQVGAFIARANEDLVPADAKLYALRDVTGTVASIPLIASSIMSKKIAEGATSLALDVKWGRGAFMPTLDQATQLAEVLVALGEDEGVRTTALVTNMNIPLGKAVGNALEVSEALEVLVGAGPADVRELTLALAKEMLELAGLADVDPATHLDNGHALAKFRELIAAQGGDLDKPLPRAAHHLDILAWQEGVLTDIDAHAVAMASWELGAGRKAMGDSIDPSAGVLIHARVGDQVQKGQALFTLFSNSVSKLESARAKLIAGVGLGEHSQVADFGPLIACKITREGLS